MAYLGAQPNKTLTKTTSQSFNGTGSATTFTLNRAVNTEEELEVFVENVQQEPGSGKSYTASGTTLTFDEAPPSGTGNVYVIYRGLAEVTTRLEHDANAALSATTGTFSGAVSGTDGTFTGDLTVDTNTLVVDAANNRVGFGTTSPQHPITVDCGAPSSADKTIANFQSESSRQVGFVWDDSQSTMGVATLTNHPFCVHINGNSNERFRIHTDGIAKFDAGNNIGRIMTRAGITVADDSSITLTNATAGAVMAMIYDTSSGDGASVFFTYSNQPSILSNPGGQFSTSDTDGKFCVLKSSNAHNVTFKNRIGGTRTFHIFLIGGDVRP